MLQTFQTFLVYFVENWDLCNICTLSLLILMLQTFQFSKNVFSTISYRGRCSQIRNLCNKQPTKHNWEYTMWKFQDFSPTQILHEITFVG